MEPSSAIDDGPARAATQEQPEEEMPSHIDALRAVHAVCQAAEPRVDNFPPTLSASDGSIRSQYIGRSISYYVTESAMIKRQPHSTELGNDIYGNPAVNPYIADRLRNEAAVLRFLRANTTIPVPEVLDLQTLDGLVSLKTAWVDGAVELCDIPASRIDAAVAAVTAQLEAEVLPQLRNLRSRRMGGPDTDMPIIPPHRFWKAKDTRVWPSVEGDYSFCHTDLDRQNILVHPQTYKIMAIIDWETAGFFPPEWELPLWKQDSREEKSSLISCAQKRDKGFFSFAK